MSALCAPAVAAVRRELGSDVLAVADVIGIRSLETSQTTSAPVARPFYRRAWRKLETDLLRHVDLVLTVNELHAELVRHVRADVPIAVVRDAAERELAGLTPLPRGQLGIPEQAVAVCFVGSLVCSRLEPIFAAWAKLETCSDSSEARLALVVIGDGPDSARYRARAAAAGWLGRSVVFTGPLPRQRALAVARACDIGYSECWSDAGFPLKVFEYLALGLPVVVEAKPQMHEVLHEGHDALFFRTPSELAKLLERLAREPTLRRRLGESGRETFFAAHTLERRQQDFVDALAQVGVDRSSSPPALAGTRS
jgi:glycosyltransferase involved in cell wall biosynthesis